MAATIISSQEDETFATKDIYLRKMSSIPVVQSNFGLTQKVTLGLRSVIDPGVLNKVTVANVVTPDGSFQYDPEKFARFGADDSFIIELIEQANMGSYLSTYEFCTNSCEESFGTVIAVSDLSDIVMEADRLYANEAFILQDDNVRSDLPRQELLLRHQ